MEMIDFHVYGTGSGPRIAFAIRPGGNPHNIKLTFTGQDSLGIDWQGALKIYMQGKWIELRQAIAYQVHPDGSMTDVGWTAAYELGQGNAYVHFTFGSYDTELPLVLQIGYLAMGGGGADLRNLNWSTYMGGTGGDGLTSIETDDARDVYACGHTWSQDFPVNPGNSVFPPFINNAAGWESAVAMKFDGDSKQLEWATYYGGDAAATAGQFAKTEAHKLAVNASGSGGPQYVFVTGTTNCSDFTPWATNTSIFSNAVQDAYFGGFHRLWVGAFKKFNGTRDWATTHGEEGSYETYEEGLAIDFNPNAGLVVGGRLFRYYGVTPSFPLVDPGAAYQQSGGGGFIIAFNNDFTIQWATTFTELNPSNAHSQVTEVCFGHGHQLWLTGHTQTGFAPYTPPNNGYQGDGGAFIAMFDLSTHQLVYFTQWGQDGSAIGYGLDYDGKQLWAVGGTHAQNLGAEDCPVAGGPGVYHTYTNSGNGNTWEGCDGFILAFNPITFELNYGTLFGGGNYDILLDVAHDNETVYFTGESRSGPGSGILADLDPGRYYQPFNANGSTRDAIVVAMNSQLEDLSLLWSTAFGGVKGERGWGIATAPGAVYLAGTTASSSWEAFPLKEFDPTSPNDYYQDYNLLGPGGNFLPFYEFEYGLDLFGTIEDSPEPVTQPHDGFIASFGTPFHVGVDAPADPAPGLLATPMEGPGQWLVTMPRIAEWTLTAYDAAGRCVLEREMNGRSTVVSLNSSAPGLYLLRATSAAGVSIHTKLLRP